MTESENTQVFTVEQAREMMPRVRERAAEIVAVRAELAELTHELQVAGESSQGGVAEVKAREARLDELVSWYAEQGIEVKGVAPLLVDFPAVRHGESVRLCWLEGEDELAWYHRTELGFMGRRPLDAD